MFLFGEGGGVRVGPIRFFAPIVRRSKSFWGDSTYLDLRCFGWFWSWRWRLFGGILGG